MELITGRALSNFNFGASGSGIAVGNRSTEETGNVYVGMVGTGGLTCQTGTAISVTSGSALNLGADDYWRSSELVLTSNSASVTVDSGGYLNDFVDGYTDIGRSSGTYTNSNINVVGDFTISNPAAVGAMTTIGVAVEITGGTMYTGGTTYNSSLTDIDLYISGKDAGGNSIKMTTGTLSLLNASTVEVEGAYVQSGGQLQVQDTNAEQLFAASGSTSETFSGGSITFNNSQGPNYYGTLELGGAVTMDGVTVRMSIYAPDSHLSGGNCDRITNTVNVGDTWSLSGGTLTITNDGAFPVDFSAFPLNWTLLTPLSSFTTDFTTVNYPYPGGIHYWSHDAGSTYTITMH